jgi:hypothetical protein
MTSKVSGPRKNSRLRIARPTANDGSHRRALGPELAFGAAVFASFAAWGASTMTLPPDLIMPVVATLFLGFAAVLAMFARRDRNLDSGQVTYADVAGALTLIGLCAAATIDPDQMVCSRAFGEPQALFDAARRDVARRRLSARPIAFASEMRTSP